MTTSPTIVVAYDGSAAARAALSRAVDRVAGGKVFVVHAYSTPADYWGGDHYQEMLDRALERGENLLDTLLDAEPRLADVDHETELIPGTPAEVVANVAEVRHADEIIVGTRGFGPIRAMLGSVAHGLLHIAPCAVTVIPERAVATRPERTEAATA